MFETVVTPLYLTQVVEGYTQALTPFYGTLTGAETYFRSKIKSRVMGWLEADDSDKIAALREATRIIESLNLSGTPKTESQLLHFPTNEDGLPNVIALAGYEIALKLIDDIDPDIEANKLSVTSQGYAGARASYDRSFVQEHIRAGIPSAQAWTILRPYLCDPQNIKLSRGS